MLLITQSLSLRRVSDFRTAVEMKRAGGGGNLPTLFVGMDAARSSPAHKGFSSLCEKWWIPDFAGMTGPDSGR